MQENIFTISRFCEITHFWNNSVNLATLGPNNIFNSLSKSCIIIIIIIIIIIKAQKLGLDDTKISCWVAECKPCQLPWGLEWNKATMIDFHNLFGTVEIGHFGVCVIETACLSE